jgi:nitroimidazol reductase NimA-like FMN-containing flavoprotein (pyridoxamine 5'-phosphate oxidase superfamily)
MASRRDQITMTPEELRAFILREHTLIIVSNGPRGFPHPMPMFFHYDDQGRFLVSTYGSSQKVVNLRRDPNAALLIEAGEVYEELQAMMAEATAEIIEDEAFVVETMMNIRRQRDPSKTEFPPQEMEQIRYAARKRVILRFTPTKMISWDHAKLGGTY